MTLNMLNVQMKPSNESGTRALFKLGNVRCRKVSHEPTPSSWAASYISLGSA